jgi:uncharacterized membrane protein YphA (DoxX/SURF4 family)/thiol-disulfide isomerase/thioredoxin
MKTIFQNRWLIFTLRLVLGIIFIVSSIAKIQDIAKFVNTVTSYGMLPDSLAQLYGNAVPWVELFIGCALTIGVFVRYAAILSIPLVISFMVASSYALLNAAGGSCGCFGKFLILSHPVSLTIDVFMLLIIFALLFYKGREFISIEQLIERFHIKSRILNAGCRLALVGLIAFVAAFGSISIHNLIKQPDNILLTVNLPTNLANDVDTALLNQEPVFMEFYISGCLLCQAAAPVISDMEKEFANEVIFIHVDYVDYFKNAQVVSDLGIKTIPTILVITSKNSEGKYNVLCRFDGIVQRNTLQTCLKKATKSQ